MAIEVAMVEVSCGTGTGDLDFEVPGFGTPQAVQFFIGGSSGGESLDTLYTGVTAHHQMLGFTDGVSNFAICQYSRLTDYYAFGYSSPIYSIFLRNSSTTTGETRGAFKEWLTDGVRMTISYNNTAGSPYKITAILFKGFTNVKVGGFVVENSGTSADKLFSISDVGFEPDAVLFFSKGNQVRSAEDWTGYDESDHITGCAINTTGLPQCAMQNKPAYRGNVMLDTGHALIDNYTASWDHWCNVDSFESTGFTMRNRGFASDPTEYWVLPRCIMYFAFQTTESIHASYVTLPATTGADQVLNIGFCPTYAFAFFNSALTSLDTWIDDAVTKYQNAYGWGLSIPDKQRCYMLSGARTPNELRCKTWTDRFLVTEGYTGSAFSGYDINGEITGLVSTGIELSYTDVNSQIILLFAFGDYVPPEFHPVNKNETISVVEDVSLIREVFGSVTCGHVTDVIEDNIFKLSDFLTGTGSASGTGDSEKLTLSTGQEMVSETFELGEGDCQIEQNKYGTGGEGTLYYRTAATRTACDAAGWTEYTGTFTSLGFVGFKVAK